MSLNFPPVYPMFSKEAVQLRHPSDHTCSSVHNEEDGRHQAKREDSEGEDGASRPTLDEGSNHDSSNTLSRLIDSLSGTN
jgi:hypothetical protein